MHVLTSRPAIAQLAAMRSWFGDTARTLHHAQPAEACGLAEWYFRSSLDRYVWIHGMACAFFHPTAEACLKRIDSLPMRLRLASRTLLAACAPFRCPSTCPGGSCMQLLCLASSQLRVRAQMFCKACASGSARCLCLSMAVAGEPAAASTTHQPQREQHTAGIVCCRGRLAGHGPQIADQLSPSRQP